MSTIRRPQGRRWGTKVRRQTFLMSSPVRALAGLERLEPRVVLAGDVPSLEVSGFWNYKQPTDVNADSQVSVMDLLPLINALSIGGSRRLVGDAAPAAAGESTASKGMYLDPNNDGALNVLDMLRVINELSAEGADPEPTIVNFYFVPVAEGTNTPITTISEGGHYELRVMVEDTGVLEYAGGRRVANQPPPPGSPPGTVGESNLGVYTTYHDLFWDRAQTDVQVSEQQLIEFVGSPTNNSTRFRLTFTDIDNTTAQTPEITYTSNKELMAERIRDGLVGIGKIGTSVVGGQRNVEVEVDPDSNKKFLVRFVNDESNKDFQNLSGTITFHSGTAPTISVTQLFAGDPNNLDSFQEMFRPRLVRDPNDFFTVINTDQNGLLYYNSYLGADPGGRQSVAVPQSDGVVNAGAIFDRPADVGGPRPGTQVVELYRLRMTANERIGNEAVEFTGAYPDIVSNLVVSVLGGDGAQAGVFAGALPEGVVKFNSGSLTITELIAAVDDTITINEGSNSVAIDVLGPQGQAGSDQDNSGAYDLVLLAPPALPAGQGTLVIRTAGQDGIARPHYLYTLPDGDFNGVINFQYGIRDGVDVNQADQGTVTINVRATNDAPLNKLGTQTNFTLAPQTMDEDQAGGLVFGGGNAISVSDVDAASSNVIVTLTTSQGKLKLASLPPSAVTINGDDTGTLTLTGPLSGAVNINSVLSGLRFTPNANLTGSATITVTSNDGGNSQDGTISPQVIGTDSDVINITINPINDAPVNTVPPPPPQQVNESADLFFSVANGNAISVSDIDSATVTVTLTATAGSVLTPAAGSGATVSAPGSTVTISGTLLQVNAALNGLKFFRDAPLDETLTVLTSDGSLQDSDAIAITVQATRRPRANNDTANAQEGDASILINVLANDLTHGTPGNFETAIFTGILSQPTIASGENAGSVAIEGGQIRYTLPAGDPNFYGTVTFTYQMNETDNLAPLGDSEGPDTGTVSVIIGNVNDNPVGVVDNFGTNEDQPLTVLAAGVLGNDSDADNRAGRPAMDTLTAQVTGAVVGGSVNLSADGSFTFTPATNFNGNASFSYRVLDGKGGQSADTLVTIVVAPQPDAPVGNPETYQATEDTLLSVNAADGVLKNDTDIDNAGNTNAGLTAVLTAPSGHGTVNLAADGSFTFQPGSNSIQTTTFKYRAVDAGGLQSPEVTVTLNVTAVNDVPVANNATFGAEEGSTLNVPVTAGLRTFVSDVEQPAGFQGTIALVPGSGPAQGTLAVSADGSFTYTPPDVIVTDFDVTFRYTASDGVATSNEATVTIRVTRFNDVPVAVGDGPFSATEDTLFTLSAPGLLGNDSDEETANTSLTAILVTPSPDGTVTVNANGSFSFNPNPNFNGQTSFTYKVRDEGLKESGAVTVTLNVAAVNDVPDAVNDGPGGVFFAIKDRTGQSYNVLANDTNGVDAGEAGEIKRISRLSQGANFVDADASGNSADLTTALGGKVRLVGGQVQYDSPPGVESGVDSFGYTLSDRPFGDATAQTDAASVQIDILNFIPKTIGGKVFIDADNQGDFDATDKPLANVEVRLSGTNLFNVQVQLIAFTDANGNYLFNGGSDFQFQGLAPGNYTITQVQPSYLTDGLETENASLASVSGNGFVAAWQIEDALTFNSHITGLNFAERGINASSLIDSSGLIGEALASSSSNGMVLLADLAGNGDWSYSLQGWGAAATCQLEVAANGSIPSLLLTVGGVTKRIYQDPSNNNGNNSPPAGSLARFRILGRGAGGDYIIRIDGTLESCGFVAAAGEAGEGEGPAMNDGQYRQAADEVFAQESWA